MHTVVQTQVPELVSLLSHSYSAHMRYGACFAVGIACAGTSSPAALRLLKPLLKDKVDYVRQGAMIAESMIVMQDASHYKRCRDKYLSVITDKHQNTMSKMGAILSTGILNGNARRSQSETHDTSAQSDSTLLLCSFVVLTD